MTTQPNDQTLINQVANFYQQYLDCSPEQLDLLALWTMHTHVIPAAPFSPALNICSRQKHSGKTLCLQLLGLLCDHGWMHTAAAPSLLLHQLTDGYEPFVGTLLLDDCDRSEEHTSELQSRENLVCRLLLEKKKKNIEQHHKQPASHPLCLFYLQSAILVNHRATHLPRSLRSRLLSRLILTPTLPHHLYSSF